MTIRFSNNIRKGFAFLAMATMLQPFGLYGVLKRHLNRVHPETALAAKPKKSPLKAKKRHKAKRSGSTRRKSSGYDADKVSLRVAAALGFLGLTTYIGYRLLQTPKGLLAIPVNGFAGGYAAPQGSYPEVLAGVSSVVPGDEVNFADRVNGPGGSFFPAHRDASQRSYGPSPCFPGQGSAFGYGKRTGVMGPLFSRSGVAVCPSVVSVADASTVIDATDPEIQLWVAEWQRKAQWLDWQQEDLHKAMQQFLGREQS